MKSTWPFVQGTRFHLSALISITLILIVLKLDCVIGQTNWSPNIEILEIIPSVDNRTETQQIKRLNIRKNSEIIVGEDVSRNSRLVIKCNATFPVQFIYIGAGRPEFTTLTNVLWRADPEAPLTFEAEVSLGLLGFQGSLREEDTGNYTCRSIQNATILSYYYIYVPGPSIFTPPEGYNSELFYTSNDKNLWIPCTAANPKAIVSLHKTSNGRLECPTTRGQGISDYDPKKGFQVNLKEVKNPDGVYVCVASYESSYRLMEYQLIPTNASLSDDGKRHPCSPSPCAKSAECNVLDGFPVCYCFRGLSGNPYSECVVNKDRCNTNKECTNGLFCVQGTCTKNPCVPLPCGRGSECVSHDGRPRCSCKAGYDGKPPYCRKKCFQSPDCPETDSCVNKYCESVCPGPCGIGAECLVVQTSYNRTAVCSCGPGFFGDPLDRCYPIGQDIYTTPPPWASCPPGYVGPAPPNCKKSECQANTDCPFPKVCKGRLCIDREGQCPNTCGKLATCQLSQISGQPTCTCPPGTTGDPLINCINTTTLSVPTSPCTPNPCLGNGLCELGTSGGVICVCPPGVKGQPPNCLPDIDQCRNDIDCPQGEECINGVCLDLCEGACGANTKCERNPRSGKYGCVCLDDYSGDPYSSCTPGRDACTPSPCANFAECRVINTQAACRCILGYEGDAYSRCYPSSRNPVDDDTNNGNPPFTPIIIDEPEVFRSTILNKRPSKTTTTERPSILAPREEDQCDLKRLGSCGRHFLCNKDFDGVARCRCVSEECQPHKLPGSGPQFSLRPINDNRDRLCRNYQDCRFPDLCVNSTCVNPCAPKYSPCTNVANSDCRIIEGQALCTCRRGFVGSPANGIDCRSDTNTNSATSLGPVVHCDIRRRTGCDTKSECRLVDGRARCVCGQDYVGQYPDCRLTCGSDRDCSNAHACVDYQCVNPCEMRNICGSNAFCRVIDHNPRCECQPGSTGNPWLGCTARGRVIRSRGLSTNCVGKRCTLF